MIANTQANPLFLPTAGLVPSANALVLGSAASQPAARFDLALLQIAKQTVDSTVAEAELNLVPEKVSKALESVLSGILRKPAEEIGRTVSQPSAAAPLVVQAVREQGLTTAQHKQLDALVRLALPRMQEALSAGAPLIQGNGGTLATPALHSGPTGGTAASLPRIEDPQAFGATAKVKTNDQDPPLATALAASQSAVQAPQPTVRLAEQAEVPALVSTRTQDVTSGQGKPSPLAGQAKPEAQPQKVVLLQEAPDQDPVTTQPKAPAAAQEAPKGVSQARPQAQAFVVQGPQVVAAPQAPAQVTQAAPQARATQPAKPAVVAPKVEAGSNPDLPVSPQKQDSNAVQPSQPSQARQAFAPSILPDVEGTQRVEVTVLKPSPLPQIQQGSEVSLSSAPVQAKPLPAPQAPVVALSQDGAPLAQPTAPQALQAPVAPAPAGVVPASPEPQAQASQAPAVQAGVQQQVPQAVQAQALAAQAPVKAAVQASPQAPAPADAEGGEAEPVQGQSPSALRRWVAEQAGLAAIAGGRPMAQQGGGSVLRGTLQGIAENVAREYSLRETVFEQALSAIGDAGAESSQLRIKLRPEFLGELEVSLKVGSDGKVTARLIASSAEVRDVFAAHLQQFRQNLENVGLQVSQLSVAVRAETGAQGNPQQAWQQTQNWSQKPSPDENSNSLQAWPQFSGPGPDNSSRFSALA